MEKVFCPKCNKEVEIWNQVKNGSWIGLEVSCNCHLAKCPCGQIVEDSRISRPEDSIIASCTICGNSSYQNPFEFEETFSQMSSELPSLQTKENWLYAERKKNLGSYPKDTENSGKWLIFIPRKKADEFWKKVRELVENGELGDSAKISTNSPKSIKQNPTEQVICVYTYNWKDEEDVMRIRQKLREIGITWKIPYKSDEDTMQLKYVATGHTKISKYYE